MTGHYLLMRRFVVMPIILLLITIAAVLYVLIFVPNVVSAYIRNEDRALLTPTSLSTVKSTKVVLPTLTSLPTVKGTKAALPTPARLSKTSGSQFSSGIDPNVVITSIVGIAGALIGAVATILAPKVTQIVQDGTENIEIKEKEKERKATSEFIEQKIEGYRNDLCSDPDIKNVHILNREKPIQVSSIYIRLKLYNKTDYVNKEISELIEKQKFHTTRELIIKNSSLLEKKVEKSIEPEEAVDKYKHCLVVGDPGSGKTTLLKYLVMKSIENSFQGLPDFPIYIELKIFVDSDFNDLLDFIDDKMIREYHFPKDHAKDFLERELKQGNILVLIDGLDETFIGENLKNAEENYRRVSKAIQSFSKSYKQSPIVVTVRKARYDQQLQGVFFGGFTELEVLDFRLSDIQDFVNKWFSEDPRKAKTLNHKIVQRIYIQYLAANPLLLSLITQLYESSGQLPINRSDLYGQCVTTLIETWENKRGIRRPRSPRFTNEHLKLLLREVAYYFHSLRQHYFPKEELYNLIGRVLRDFNILDPVDHILAEITDTGGLLKRQGEDHYGFLHLTFQEYFVAQYIADAEESTNRFLERGEDPWWREAILLSARAPRDTSHLLKICLQRISETSSKDIFHTDLILAGHCLAANFSIKQPSSLKTDIINHLFSVLTTESYSLIRQQIARILIEIDDLDVNQRLIQLLKDKNVEKNIKEIISDTFSDSGEYSINSVVIPLLSDTFLEKDLRLRIAISLGSQKNSSIASQLLEIATTKDIDVDVRASIIYSLGASEEEDIISGLVDLLRYYPDDCELQMAIIGTMSKSGKALIIPQLLSFLSEDTRSDVRVCSINALGSLNYKSGESEFLHILLDTNTPLKERLSIVDIMSKLGDESMIIQLQTIYTDTQFNIDIKHCIALILVSLGKQELSADLLQFLTEPHIQPEISRSIVITLVRLGDSVVIEQLLNLCSGNQIEKLTQVSFFDALGVLGDSSFVPNLMRLVYNTRIDAEVRAHIIYALLTLGENLAVSDVLPLLSNKNIDVQILQHILTKLAEKEDPSLVQDFSPLLSRKDINSSVRKVVAKGIGKLANDEVTAIKLVNLLYSPDIKDDVSKDAIYSALWQVSHQARIKIEMIDGPVGKEPKISKWS